MSRPREGGYKNVLRRVVQSSLFRLINTTTTFMVPIFNISYYKDIDDSQQYVFWVKVFLVFLVYNIIDRLLYLFYNKSEYIPHCLSLIIKIYLISNRNTLEIIYKHLEAFLLSIRTEEIVENIQEIVMRYIKQLKDAN